MVCIRPLGSVSCTRSPTASGPRRWAAPVGPEVSGGSVAATAGWRSVASRIDVRAREATLDGKQLDLSPKEFELLAYLAVRPGQVVTQRRAAHRGVAAAVRRLLTRRSTCTCPGCVSSSARLPRTPRYLQTVRGVGVQLVGPDDSREAAVAQSDQHVAATTVIVLVALLVPMAVLLRQYALEDLLARAALEVQATRDRRVRPGQRLRLVLTRSASLGARQGPLDVGGRRASRRRHRWPRPRGTRWPGRAVMASISCSPVRSACSVRSLLQATAQVADRHPRPALDRHLAHGALGHQPDRRARPVDDDQPAGTRQLRAAQRLGQRHVDRHRDRAPGERPADTAGSRCWTLPCRIDWLAPTQMNAPSRAAQMTSTSETSRLAQRGDQERQGEQDDGDAAAGPAGDDRAGVPVTGGPPHRGRHHPAAVQRAGPGSRLKAPTSRLLSISAQASRRPTVPGRAARRPRRRPPPAAARPAARPRRCPPRGPGSRPAARSPRRRRAGAG